LDLGGSLWWAVVVVFGVFSFDQVRRSLIVVIGFVGVVAVDRSWISFVVRVGVGVDQVGRFVVVRVEVVVLVGVAAVVLEGFVHHAGGLLEADFSLRAFVSEVSGLVAPETGDPRELLALAVLGVAWALVIALTAALLE
jgi:hypothetical protein